MTSTPDPQPTPDLTPWSGLRGLMEVAALVRSREDIQRLLENVAKVLCTTLGYKAVLVNLYRPAWHDYAGVVFEGISQEAIDSICASDVHLGPRHLDMIFQERFERHGVYFLPAEDFDPTELGAVWAPGTPGAPGPNGWHENDNLFVPLRATDRSLLGFLSLDGPEHGCRPTDADLEVLGAVGEIIALVIEHAQLGAETTRHRNAVAHLQSVSSRLLTRPSREDMLRTVCAGVRDALGFERVTVFLDQQGDGILAPSASVGWEGSQRRLATFAAADLEPAIAAGVQEAGCLLLDRETAARLGVPRLAVRHWSRRNGRGPLSWQGHCLIVELRDHSGELVGALWADDPNDRLLPVRERLQALRAFANHAVTAIESAHQVERLRRLAEHDPLTGLRNRRNFETGLQLALERDERVALVVCDLDHFKRINDALGHPGGDEVLRRFADVLRSCVRADDEPTRLGGEEFALVLHDADVEEGVTVAERMRREVHTHFAGFPVPVTVSVGIASTERGKRDVGGLVRDANRALYAAKPAAATATWSTRTTPSRLTPPATARGCSRPSCWPSRSRSAARGPGSCRDGRAARRVDRG